jgi:hypothetical protein
VKLQASFLKILNLPTLDYNHCGQRLPQTLDATEAVIEHEKFPFNGDARLARKRRKRGRGGRLPASRQ